MNLPNSEKWFAHWCVFWLAVIAIITAVGNVEEKSSFGLNIALGSIGAALTIYMTNNGNKSQPPK